jgi:hypothetical protein
VKARRIQRGGSKETQRGALRRHRRQAEMKTAILLTVLLLALPLWAHPSYSQLQAKAAKAHGHKRAELLAQLAKMDFARARRSFEAGQSVPGRRDLKRLARHGAESMQLLRAEAGRGKRDGMRHVEIRFQRISYGLSALRREASFSDQPAIGAVQRRYARWRRTLLEWLFARKEHGHLILTPNFGYPHGKKSNRRQ